MSVAHNSHFWAHDDFQAMVSAGPLLSRKSAEREG
jgi:hypothetical protein